MRLDSPFRSIFPASLVKRGRHVTVPRVRRTPRINILRLARQIGGNRSAFEPRNEIFRSLDSKKEATKERPKEERGEEKEGSDRGKVWRQSAAASARSRRVPITRGL